MIKKRKRLSLSDLIGLLLELFLEFILHLLSWIFSGDYRKSDRVVRKDIRQQKLNKRRGL